MTSTDQDWAAGFRSAAAQATARVDFDAERTLAAVRRRHQQRTDTRLLPGGSAPERRGAGLLADRRTGRLVLAGAAALAVAGVLVVGPGDPADTESPLAPAVAAAGVTFTDAGGAVLAEITDPEASAAAMTAAFQEEGYDIRVTLVPSAPELVGTVVMFTGGIQVASPREGCVTAGGAPCMTAVRVPAGFEGFGEISIGRQPSSGEDVVSSNDVGTN